MGNLLSHVQFLDFSEALGFQLEEIFPSLDAYTIVALNMATVTLADGVVSITGNTTGSSGASLQRFFEWPRVDLTYDKKVILELWPAFDRKAAPDEDIFIRVGDKSIVDKGFGFHTKNDGIYGHSGDGSNYSELKIADAGPGAFTWDGILKAVLIPGSRVEFYIEGVYIGQITEHLPSDYFDPYCIFSAYVGPGAAAPHELYMSGFRFFQGQ